MLEYQSKTKFVHNPILTELRIPNRTLWMLVKMSQSDITAGIGDRMIMRSWERESIQEVQLLMIQCNGSKILFSLR